MSPTPSPSGETTATAGCTKTPVYWKSSAVEIGRSGSDGRFRSVPSNAIVAEPPLSSAIPVTAPSRTSAWASSKFVIPIEYPGWRPSTVTRIILPSASWPTALRGARGPSWLVVKISPALKIGAPSRTICGPPPIAETMSGQSGLRLSWVVTICPTGASAVSAAAAAPTATRTAPPGGIGTAAPPVRSSTTGAWRSVFGVAAGNGNRIADTAPGFGGVAGPHTCV